MLIVFSPFSFADSVDVTHKFNLSGELKDCKIFKATNDSFLKVFLFITKCPNSKTSTSTNEKSPTHTFYSEEVEYDTINKSDTINFNGEEYKVNEDELDMTKSIKVNGKTYFKVK